MTLNAGTVWEVRPTGSGANTNGGGFYNRVPGTSVDYSQQTLPVLSLSNFATDGAGTVLLWRPRTASRRRWRGTSSSWTAGWAPRRVSTSCKPSSATTPPLWTITVEPANPASPETWAGPFTLAGATNDLLFFKAAVAGNTIYFASGTHTISVTNSGLMAGFITNPINLIGYNSSRSTIPTGDDRPLINCSGTTYFSVAGSWNLYHLRGTTATASYVFYNSSGASIWVNLKATNTYASGTAAMQMSGGAIFGSEVSCTHGTGIVGGPDAYACLLTHDSVTVFFTVNTATLCVAANCTSYGISASYVARPIAVNCTVYNCGTGVYCNLATIYAVSIINTIVSGCTRGSMPIPPLRSWC